MHAASDGKTMHKHGTFSQILVCVVTNFATRRDRQMPYLGIAAVSAVLDLPLQRLCFHHLQ